MNNDNNIRLEKKLSSLHVWALALGCIIGWGAFVMPGNTFLGKAGPLGTAIAMLIAAFVMIIIAFNYNYMIQKYPVAGGEFTYTDKAFGRRHAFFCSWFLGLSYLCIVPLNGTALALIGRNLMNNIFQVGFHYEVAGYDIYVGEIVLAIVALVAFAMLSIKGVYFTGVFQTILVFALVGGVGLVAIAALFSDKASFANLSPAFYESAKLTSTSKLGGVLAVVAVAPWAFVGFDTIPQSAEEFKFSPRKTKVIMVVSILFGAGVYIILNTITAMVVPEGYASWVEYIDDLPNLSGLETLPTFYAAKTLLGTAGLVFLGIAVLAAILSGICGFYMATSRLLYSMAKENVLPSWFGRLHKKNKTPANAILFIMLIAMIAPFFGRTALGWVVDMSSIGAAIGYGYTSAAAFKFARKEKNKNVMFTGALGMVFALVFTILLLIPIGSLGCSLSKESYLCLAVWTILGGVFYVSTRKNRQKSADGEAVNKKSKYSKRNNKLYVKAVAKATGWDTKTAKKIMEEARERTGCTFHTYLKYAFYNMTDEEQMEKQEKVVARKERRKRVIARKQKKAVERVMEETGWSKEKAESIMQEAADRTGCLFEEYAEFQMYKYPENVQNEMFFKSMSKKITKRYNTDKSFNLLLCDKDATNKHLMEYVKRPWVTTEGTTFEEFCETFKGIKKVFYKPLSLNGGRGAVPFDLTEENMKEVYDEVTSYESGVVEKYVIQHHKLNELSSTAVNTLRFVTVSSDVQPVTADGKQFDFAYVVQKMGGENSVVDNLHAGGIAAVVDMEKGVIATDGIDQYGNIVEYHPVTGTKIKGFEIPMYHEAVEMIKDAVEKYNLVGYLGWDVSIEEDGPSLIELNLTPGVNLITHTLSVTEHRGYKKEMEKYLF